MLLNDGVSSECHGSERGEELRGQYTGNFQLNQDLLIEGLAQNPGKSLISEVMMRLETLLEGIHQT